MKATGYCVHNGVKEITSYFHRGHSYSSFKFTYRKKIRWSRVTEIRFTLKGIGITEISTGINKSVSHILLDSALYIHYS